MMTHETIHRPTESSMTERHSTFLELLVFLLVGVVIVSAAWPGINVRNFEIGDFAANGLLIHDAKHLALLTGNYSRIGVHHPGPAILYVLAFGELVFNDILHLTKSAFSGQLIAACFYTSAWLVVIWREFSKLSRSVVIGACLASLFAALIAYFNFNFFTDVWFPDLYVFPFAAMTLTLARLASGRADSLIALAVSAGFLINGHVSFVATLGIVFVISIVVNGLTYRRDPERRVLGVVFLRTHARVIGMALFVLALFFVPLLIETIISFPGPVPDYVNFGTGRVIQPIPQSVIFVASFWGGLAPMWGSFIAAALVVVAARLLPQERRGIIALVVVLMASTVALFFYAHYGIDYLEFTYLGYYYYTTPALLFTIMGFVTLSAGGVARRTAVVLAITLFCAALTYWKIDRPVRDLDQYNQPEVVKLYDVIKAAAGNGPIALDLDTRQEFGHLWTNLVGAQAYALRQDERLFCINKNWHILFTEAVRCTADELKTRTRYTVRVEHGTPRAPVAFEARDIVFSPYRVPDITDKGRLEVLKERERLPRLLPRQRLVAAGGRIRLVQRSRVASRDPLASRHFRRAQTRRRCIHRSRASDDHGPDLRERRGGRALRVQSRTSAPDPRTACTRKRRGHRCQDRRRQSQFPGIGARRQRPTGPRNLAVRHRV